MMHVIILTSDPAIRETLRRWVGRCGWHAVANGADTLSHPLIAIVDGLHPAEWAYDELPDGAVTIGNEDSPFQQKPAVSQHLEAPLTIVSLRQVLADMGRQVAQPQRIALACGVIVDCLTGQMTHAETGKADVLTDKELALMVYLASCEGEIVGKETLLQEIWRYQPEVDTHTVETHIYRLRNKMDGVCSGAGDCVTTENGGYCFSTNAKQ